MNIFEYTKGKTCLLNEVGEHTYLKKFGDYWKGECPLCKKDDRFTISILKQIYYCHSCNSGGDVVTFTSAIQKCSPLEAVQYLIIKHKIERYEEETQKTSK